MNFWDRHQARFSDFFLGDGPDYFELRTLPDGRIHKIIEITNTTILNIYDTFQISK